MIGICPPTPDLFDPQQRPMAGAPVDIEHWAGNPAAWFPCWEGAGGSVEEINGCGLPLPLVGGVSWMDSDRGRVLLFDGLSGVAGSTTTVVRGSVPVSGSTVSCWIKFAPTANFVNAIDIKGTSVDTQFYSSGGNGQIRYHALNGTDISSVIRCDDGLWHHIVGVVYSLADKRLFVDGIQRSQSTAAGTAQTYGRIVIGARINAPYDLFFPGNVADVRIYPFALSAAQAFDLYNDPSLGILRRGPQPWFLGVAASSITAVPGVAAVAVAVVGPTVILGSVSAAAGTANVAVQTVAPAVVLGPVSQQPGVATVTLDVAAPSVSGQTTVAAGVASVTVAIVSPAVSLGPVSIACGHADVAAAVIAPAVALGPVTLQPGAASINVTVVAPTQGPPIDVTAGVGLVTIDASGPAVTFPSASPTIEIWQLVGRPTVWVA